MKLLVVGSRNVTDEKLVYGFIDSAIEDIKQAVTELYQDGYEKKFQLFEDPPDVPPILIGMLSGGAGGVDTLANNYAIANGIAFVTYPADWKNNGKGAGYIRNKQMVNIADVCLAIWDGESNGTKHTITLCQKKGIPLTVKTIKRKDI